MQASRFWRKNCRILYKMPCFLIYDQLWNIITSVVCLLQMLRLKCCIIYFLGTLSFLIKFSFVIRIFFRITLNLKINIINKERDITAKTSTAAAATIEKTPWWVQSNVTCSSSCISVTSSSSSLISSHISSQIRFMAPSTTLGILPIA